MTGESLRVVGITGGKNDPSGRYRIDALVPSLLKRQIELSVLCPRISKYPPESRLLRIPWLTAALIERLSLLQRTKTFDAVIFQRELISTLPTLERLIHVPRILDVDDAIHLHRSGRAAKFIANSCALVVCGNQFLAEIFAQWNSNVVVIPTGVDAELLRPLRDRDRISGKTIGWIGSAGNYQYLKMLEPVLTNLCSQYPDVRLQIIADIFPTFLAHLGDQLDYRKWQPGIENILLPQLTIGIMPLRDEEWARGKCAFKMLQYMAAGIPVVATPVGVSASLFASDDIGMAAKTDSEWLASLSTLLTDSAAVRQLGDNGRKLVEREYSVSLMSAKWQEAINDMLN